MTDHELSEDEDGRSHRFNVTIQMRAKNADLLRAARRMGSAAKLAKHLGVSQMTMSQWMRLKRVPNLSTENSSIWRSLEHRAEIEQKLFDLTGKTLEELWPECIRSQDFLDLPKNAEFEVNSDVRDLALRHEELVCLPSPDRAVEQDELAEAMKDALETLPPRYSQALRLRYGLDGGECLTLDDAAEEMKLSRNRIRQMEVIALRKLADVHQLSPDARKKLRSIHSDIIEPLPRSESPFLADYETEDES